MNVSQRFWRTSFLGWLPLAAFLCASGRPAVAQWGALYNLDQNAALWQLFIDPPGNTAYPVLANVSTPSLDGTALRLGILPPPAGAPLPTPYTGVQAYVNVFPPQLAALKTFQFSARFRYRSSPYPVQAIEFTQSKWQNGLRWEWALQWENIGDGTPQQGNPPCWRLWNGTGWQPIGLTQRIAPDVWHALALKGTITPDGRVQYIAMNVDGVLTNLGQTFAPVAGGYQQLSVGVQLDGDAAMHPQDVYLDRFAFSWQ